MASLNHLIPAPSPAAQVPVAERHRGFTLIEVLITVAIIAVLATVLLNVFGRGRATARRVQCDTHLKALALALDAFKQEHGGYPSGLTQLETDKYIQDTGLMRCPSDPRDTGTYADYYVLRASRSDTGLPILVCPFHEAEANGNQAYVGRYTTQFRVKPAVLQDGADVTVQHPGESPVAAPRGLELHGADRISTGPSGFAVIQFADGSKASVQHDATVTVLQSFTDGQNSGVLYTLIRQTAGRVIYNVNHGSKFDVATPTATAGALGTNFELRIDPVTQETWLRVYLGKVRFTNLGGDIIPPLYAWFSAKPIVNGILPKIPGLDPNNPPAP